MTTAAEYNKKVFYIPTVTETGEIIGQIERWEAHKKGILHKGFSVALFYKDQILLQLRKHPVFDKVVDVTASSHPLVIDGKNQPEEEAVFNCLKREWNVSKDEVINFTNRGSFVYKAADGAGYIEHEYCTFYSAIIDRLPQPDLEFAYGYISVELEFFKQNPQMYNLAPWVKEGMKFLKK